MCTAYEREPLTIEAIQDLFYQRVTNFVIHCKVVGCGGKHLLWKRGKEKGDKQNMVRKVKKVMKK